MIKLDTTNAHNAQVIERFNKVSSKLDDSTILDYILSRWADDANIDDIASDLEEIVANETNSDSVTNA